MANLEKTPYANNSNIDNTNSYLETTQTRNDRSAYPSRQMTPRSFRFLFIGIANIDIILALLIGISELLFVAIPDTYVEVYNIYNMKGEVVHGIFPHESWIFMTVLIFATFWLIIEFWLYQILYKGSLELDTVDLNRWVNVRSIFLILSIIQTLYRITELQFCFYDLIHVPVQMFRVLEIIFVKGLTVEILNAQFELNV